MVGLQCIVKVCVASKNAGGGSFVMIGSKVDIHLDSSNNDFRAVGEKRTTKPKSSALKSKPKPTMPPHAKPISGAPKSDKKPPTERLAFWIPEKEAELAAEKVTEARRALQRLSATSSPSYSAELEVQADHLQTMAVDVMMKKWPMVVNGA
jgi:hypothetical protein